MDPDYGLSGHSSSEATAFDGARTQQGGDGDKQGPGRPKRSRILLSCAPCRMSKLKCDRASPCGQCQKKGRVDLCQYAPKPDKRKPAKTMSARLKRLEGMVRGMMDADGNPIPGAPGAGDETQQQLLQQVQQLQQAGGSTGEKSGSTPTTVASGQTPEVKGQVVRGQNATTSYVGATHVMAMLEDIEDLKHYFEDSEEEEDEGLDMEIDAPEMMLFSRGAPRNREELLDQLPEKAVMDRLITRYFQGMSPSQHIVHRPTFARTYARFCQDPNDVHLAWIAQLFMMLALGVHFNGFQAPNELEGDSPVPAPHRVRLYRSCAGWALVWSKYTQPNQHTLPAFVLYLESHFIFNRAAQMNCYLLSGVCIRLMLKMGLHRDPDKLQNLTPYEGEMRRRMWNMALQVETIVSFHMGLPSMLQSIESDTAIPRNLKDEDFDENSKELPPSRPISDWTNMSYPVNKTAIVRVFSQIARQVHALSPPSYSDVLRLDHNLQETWRSVPTFLKVRPLDECVGEPPTLLIQRFGLEALYNKARCVLHRRYLAEPVPRREHDYSRQQCFQAALTLLDYQKVIWEACKPGHSLAHHGWFVSSLSVHDYLLAAMVLYMVIQNEHYNNPDSEHNWASKQLSAPSKDELKEMIRVSHDIWLNCAESVTEVRRTADTLAMMLERLGTPVNRDDSQTDPSPIPQTVDSKDSMGSSIMPQSSVSNIGSGSAPFSSIGSMAGPGTGQTPFSLPQTTEAMGSMSFPEMQPTDAVPTAFDFDPSWMTAGDSMDWRFLDVSLAHSHTAGANSGGPGDVWTERIPGAEDLGLGNTDFWS